MATCSRCRGEGTIWSGPFNDGRGLRAGKMIPCPDCRPGDVVIMRGVSCGKSTDMPVIVADELAKKLAKREG